MVCRVGQIWGLSEEMKNHIAFYQYTWSLNEWMNHFSSWWSLSISHSLFLSRSRSSFMFVCVNHRHTHTQCRSDKGKMLHQYNQYIGCAHRTHSNIERFEKKIVYFQYPLHCTYKENLRVCACRFFSMEKRCSAVHTVSARNDGITNKRNWMNEKIESF